jgi:hypothetical protein
MDYGFSIALSKGVYFEHGGLVDCLQMFKTLARTYGRNLLFAVRSASARQCCERVCGFRLSFEVYIVLWVLCGSLPVVEICVWRHALAVRSIALA